MYYRKALRDAGLDPVDIKDAQESDEFILHIGISELKGSEIGHPMNCAGAKACKTQQHATFAWIGACTAILGFPDGRILRYQHNGQLPKKHDQGMFALGDYRFRRLRYSRLPAVQMKKFNKGRKNKGICSGIRKGIVVHGEPSLATQMRRGWEVKTD